MAGTIAWLSLEFLLVAAIFTLYSSSPPPDVNEAHYLAKAKHFWNPDWCPDDQFLNSADAHATFYWSFGWLTLHFSLPTVAWIGRAIVCTLLACGWLSISRAVCKAPLASVLSAGIYALLTKHGHMSGEWVLGGVEAKGFAYGCSLIAIGLALRGRWTSSWILLGMSSSFHVLVGGWTVVALAFAWLTWRDDSKASLKQMLPGLIVGGTISLAGLLPGMALTFGADPASVAKGEQVYVFQRLSHHLLISHFPREFITRHLLLIMSALLIYFLLGGHRQMRLLLGVVFGAALIAACGAIIDTACGGNEALGAKVLKFYWYRVSDAYAPLALALAAPCLIVSLVGRTRLATAIIAAVMLTTTLANEAYPRFTGSYPRADAQAGLVRETGHQKKYDDWIEACKWINENTPENAIFVTPERQQTFKWYAGRGELVTWKDVPQDAKNISEWLSRRDAVAQLRPRRGVIQDQETKLSNIAKQYGATHYLFEWRRTSSRPQHGYLHHNGTYVVYRIESETL